MNNAGKWTLMALLLAAPLLHAQEDEDDPKGSPHRPATIAPARPRPPAEKPIDKPPVAAKAIKSSDAPARPEPKAAEPAVKRAADVRPAKPIADAKPAPAGKTLAEPAEPKPAARPGRPAVAEADALRRPAAEADAPRRPAAEAEPPRRAAARPPETTTAKVASPSATIDPSSPSPARTVRVRLSDGSSVVGMVHAEESDALIIDCSLGQLAIPRSRISTIAYDAAAGAGSKHAPVQQLDDDDRLPVRKRPAIAQ